MEQQEDDEFWSPLGFGLDRHRLKLKSPVEARLFRRYTSLPDALRAIPVLTPRKSASGKDHRLFLALLVRELLDALGEWPYDYEAARNKLARRTETLRRKASAHPDFPQFAREADTLIPRLIALYEEPRKFFNEVAPEVYPLDFSEFAPGIHGLLVKTRRTDLLLSHSPFGVLAAEWLGRILRTWGCAALFNRSVRLAFDSAPPRVVLEALAIAEGRKTYHPKGPGIGTTKGKLKKGRADHPRRRNVFEAFVLALEDRARSQHLQLLKKEGLIERLKSMRSRYDRPLDEREARREAFDVCPGHLGCGREALKKSLGR